MLAGGIPGKIDVAALAALSRVVQVAYEAGNPGFTVQSVRAAVYEAFMLGQCMTPSEPTPTSNTSKGD